MKLRTFLPAAEHLERRDLLASIPVLHSFPDADHVIYLDFDGQLVTESSFNGSEFPYIHASPFDVDGLKYDSKGVPTFSAEEVTRIVSIWERMAEDYRPFNVDVTTVNPAHSDPTIFSQPGRALRVLFTSPRDNGWGGTGQRWYDGDSRGVAEHEAFFAEQDAPAWVFSTHPVGAGEIGSHEVGHALGLHHHGDSSATFLNEYRGPHGSGETRWSPIMGQGNVLTQWSRGEYPHATNDSQDDIGKLSVGLGRRPDDYAAFETLLPASGTEISREGIIAAQGDNDTFTFEITEPNTRVTIQAKPWHNGPNLDIGLSLFRLPGSQICGYGDISVNPVDRLASSLNMELDPGTYYLSVTGRGKPATPDDPGYSNYGSLGYYQLTGTIDDSRLRGDINQDGRLSAEDIDALYAFIGVDKLPDERSLIANLNGDHAVDQGDVDVLVHDIFRTEYGDFDLDGRVDFGDFLKLAASFGTESRGWAHGDATGDGEVLFADFLLLAAAFGFEND